MLSAGCFAEGAFVCAGRRATFILDAWEVKTYGTLHDFGRAKAALALLGTVLACRPQVSGTSARGPEPLCCQRDVC